MVTFHARLAAIGPASAPTPLPPEQGILQELKLPDMNGNERTVRVLLPPSYGERSRRKYPLLLMQDGQNLFQDKETFPRHSWALGAALADGRRSGNLRDVIAVGIDNDGFNREYEYTPWHFEAAGKGGGADRYLDWVENTVLPELERHYRVSSNREERIIGGSSLGAVLSLYAMVKKSHLFGGAALMSGTWQWAYQDAEGKPVNMVDWISRQWGSFPRGVKLWQSVGRGESDLNLYQPNFRMSETLGGMDKNSGAFRFEHSEGGHDELSWRRQINDPDKQGPERYGPLGFFFPA